MLKSPRTFAIVTALAAGLVVAASTAVASGAAPSSPWSQTNSDSAQSRANLNEHTIVRATVTKVRYLRSVVAPVDPPGQLGCASDTLVTPVLTGGKLYAVASGRLTKYNPATGSIIWRHRLSAANDGTSLSYEALSVAGGVVVVGENSCDSVSDPNGYVQAFSATTGSLKWSKPITPSGGALGTMVVSGAYVAAAGSSAGGGNVVSVRRLSTGASVWHRVTQQCAPSAVAVIANLVMSYRCSPSLAETLTANHLASGALAWSRPGAWQIQRGNLGTGGHLYATNPAGTVVGLDPATGQTKYKLPGATTVLAVDNTRAYADCGSLGVCAYSTATGGRLWDSQPGAAPALAAEAGGVLYLDQGLALNSGTGQAITSLWSGTATALAIGDGRIAVIADPRVLDLFGLHGS